MEEAVGDSEGRFLVPRCCSLRTGKLDGYAVGNIVCLISSNKRFPGARFCSVKLSPAHRLSDELTAKDRQS